MNLFLLARGKCLSLERSGDLKGGFRLQLFHDELTDTGFIGHHPEMKRAEIYHLKRYLPVEPGMDRGSRQMHYDPNTSQRASALNASGEFIVSINFY